MFRCPAAALGGAWDTNVNSTLGARGPNGVVDPYGLSEKSRFSYGYNDWGLDIQHIPQLGMGGDVNGAVNRGPVTEDMIRSPSRMIAIGDLKPTMSGRFRFDANLDPVDCAANHSQWLSNRHNYWTNLVFADGHVEAVRRRELINPGNTDWRARWNNDDQPTWK